MGALNIAGEDPGCEAGFGVVGAGNDLGLFIEGKDGHDGAKNFLSGDDHIVGDVCEYSGLHEQAVGHGGNALRPATCDQPCALRLAGVDKA